MKPVTLMFVSVFIFLLMAGAVADDAVKSPRLITVTGEAQVNVIPDEVAISIGVQACGGRDCEEGCRCHKAVENREPLCANN